VWPWWVGPGRGGRKNPSFSQNSTEWELENTQGDWSGETGGEGAKGMVSGKEDFREKVMKGQTNP